MKIHKITKVIHKVQCVYESGDVVHWRGWKALVVKNGPGGRWCFIAIPNHTSVFKVNTSDLKYAYKI